MSTAGSTRTPRVWLSTQPTDFIKEEVDPLELSSAPTSKSKEMPALIPLKTARLEERRPPSMEKRGGESQFEDKDSSRQNGTRSKDLKNHPEAGSPKGGSRANQGFLPRVRWHPPPMRFMGTTHVQKLIEGSRPF